MLRDIEVEIRTHNLNNITTLEKPWPLTEELLNVDVAFFTVMCPATRSVESIQAMSTMASKYGVIGQFTKSTDNIIDTLLANIF